VATPTAKNTRIAVPRNSTAHFLIILPVSQSPVNERAHVLPVSTTLANPAPRVDTRCG
jgi:hypothetical protein